MAVDRLRFAHIITSLDIVFVRSSIVRGRYCTTTVAHVYHTILPAPIHALISMLEQVGESQYPKTSQHLNSFNAAYRSGAEVHGTRTRATVAHQ